MKAIKETIGNTTILIQAIEEDLDIIGETASGRATELTGVEDQLKEAYSKTKLVINAIAEDIGAHLKKIRSSVRPDEVEMEFSIGISAQAGPIWILSGKGETGLKVTMTWELEKDEQSDRPATR